MEKKNIDIINIPIVYLWVDSSDINYIRRYPYLKKNSRNRNNNELKCSLRSVEKNMSWWKGQLFIVTDNQVPKWLNINKNVTIVDHKDIIPKYLLPTFNSNIIQRYLHNIKEINDFFLLFDDDFMILNEVKPTDLFRNNKPIIRFNNNFLNNSNYNFYNTRRMWSKSIYYTINILEQNTKIIHNKKFLHHAPYIFSKNIIKEIHSKFNNLFIKNKYKLRNKYDINCIYLYTYYHCLKLNLEIKPLDDSLNLNISNSTNLSNLYKKLIKNKKHIFVCFNDYFSSIYSLKFQVFLYNLFNIKSAYEK